MDGGDDYEAAFGRPVDGVAVLFLDGADVLEVADAGALDFLGAEEGDGCFGGHGCSGDDLGGGDEAKAITFGFPCEVDDSVFYRVDDLDRYAFLLNTEDLEVRGERFLGLGMTVDFHADVCALGLPMELCVRDVEEVAGSDDFLSGNVHQTDFGRIAADFRRPEAEELLVGFLSFALRRSWCPFKVPDAFDFDGCLVEKVHLWELVDGY